jgi:glycosyltransferase involved in cell wall biosynthesis
MLSGLLTKLRRARGVADNASAPVGYVDHYTSDRIEGWIVRNNQVLILERDGRRTILSPQFHWRADLQAAGIEGQGFYVSIPFEPGSHVFRVGLEDECGGVRYLPHSGTQSDQMHICVEVYSDPAAKQLSAVTEASPDVLFVIGCWEGESKRYRVYNIAAGLEALSLTASITDFSHIADIARHDVRPKCVVFFRCPFTLDLAVGEVLEHLRSRGCRLIYDIDDYVFEPSILGLIDGVNQLTDEQRNQYRASVEMYRRFIMSCDHVTVTTDFLRHKLSELGISASVVRNTVNAKQKTKALSLIANRKPVSEIVRIGYFSGSLTHQKDFEICAAALKAIMRVHGNVVFRLVGLLHLDESWNEFRDRIERFNFLPYLDMLEALSECDINLAPLVEGNPFCEGKSELKYFEAAIVEVPTIASRTEPFAAAIVDGSTGLLASNEGEWQAALEALISSPEQRKIIGKAARLSVLNEFDYVSAAVAARRAYGLSPKIDHSRNPITPSLSVGLLVPGMIIGGGGHRNIFRIAYYMEQFGHSVTLYFTQTTETTARLKELIKQNFYPFSGDVEILSGRVSYCDVLFATHWSTVSPALSLRRCVGEIIYLVQDFEPYFSPMGSEYLLAENTYRQNLYAIASGPWCARLLQHRYNMEVDHFQFPIDRTIYFKRDHPHQHKLIFFAKPEMPRRCFELGAMALRKVHDKLPALSIVFFGSRHECHVDYPVIQLGVLPTIKDVATLYSSATLGIAFSSTNPSLVPYEMMACGLPTVDLATPGNELNYGNRTDVAFLADIDPDVMADQICTLLADEHQLRARSEAGLALVAKMPSEEETARRIERLILRRVVFKAPV